MTDDRMRRSALLLCFLCAACDQPVLGAGARVEWEPRSHSFPQTRVGSSTTAVLTLKNTGARDVAVTSILLAPGSSPAFEIVEGAGGAFTLRPQGRRAVTVRYAPTAAGEARGLLRALTAAGNVDAVLSNQPPAPRIEIEPSFVDFGIVSQGQRAERELKIRNVGTAPLSVSRVGLSAASHADFRLELGATTVPVTLDILHERAIKVVFAPSGGGARTGTLEVASDDPRTPLATVPLRSGESVPRISIDPTSLDFGPVQQGQQRSLDVRVTNAGTAVLQVTPSVSGSSEFSVAGGLRVLQPNETVPIAVTYAPTDVGVDEGTLTLAHNDPSQGLIEVPLSGGAEPSIDVSPLGVQFTNVAQFSQVEQRVVLTNVGYGDLVLGAIAFGTGPGESSPEYTLVGVPAAGTRLARGRSASFTVRYVKQTSGNPLAVVYIPSNDPDPSKNPYELYVLAVGGIQDQPPTAAIACSNCNGSVLNAAPPVEVRIDGSGSTDPEGQTLLYSWAMEAIPEGSQAVIADPMARQTTFTADTAGTYRVTLVVRDTSGQYSPRVAKDITVLP